MKPLNLDNKPCSPISSNCVIWQGPDIPCIKLCTGDTVSDVVFKLATELCTIMDQLNVSNYDLACFDLASCTPQTFQELLQFLINQICAALGVTPTDTKVSGCPDCVVSVAPCFVQGTQTTMQLVDYVQLIGNRICSIIDEITAINNQITTINATLVDLQYQIDNLPVYTLPEIPVDCILGPGNHPLDTILDALMNDDVLGYCALLAATGTPAEINSAVLSQCIADGDQPLAALPAVNTFSAYYAGSWVAAPALGASPTVANAINNAWIAICDIYNYLSTGFSTTVVDAGDGILVSSTTVGSTTTYTVTNDYLETFGATVTIKNTYSPDSGLIPKVDPSTVKGIHEGQVVLKYTTVSANGINITTNASVSDYVTNACLPDISFGIFDNTTGIFTITDAGNYLINANANLKPDEGSTVYWSGPTTYSTLPTVNQLADNFKAIGTFILGICPSTTSPTQYYAAQEQTLIPNIDRNISVTTTKVINAAAGTTLRVMVLNTTNRDYDGRSYGTIADSISFSIIKLKNGLTSSTCP